MTKEEIESFGFVPNGKHNKCDFWTETPIKLYGMIYSDKINLEYDYLTNLCYIGCSGQIVFHGKISTKEELSVILKQIGFTN